ncbi:oocyte zinc finger protein XlCOF29-like [Dendrobates tinctorius]|uniref:oocyte zinc finger protein XlCOF29-like n=1 Tax=Dendrobates tinctorius TaxID=92724 RepID=UPI003CCA49FC
MERDKMAERILHLTLEILFRLTGEDYTVVKKTSRGRCQDPVSEGWETPLSPITGPPPHPLIHEDINDQKILELTYKMIELLTGEVTLLGMLGHYTVTLWRDRGMTASLYVSGSYKVSGCHHLFLHGGVELFRRTHRSVQGRHDGGSPAPHITSSIQ